MAGIYFREPSSTERKMVGVYFKIPPSVNRREQVLRALFCDDPQIESVDQRCVISTGDVYMMDSTLFQYQGTFFNSTPKEVCATLRTKGLAGLIPLDGAFNVLFYDEETKTLTLAKDQFGFIPLKLVETPEFILWANHPADLVKSRLFKTEINWEMISLLSVVWLQSFSQTDYIKPLRNLLPGQALVAKENQIEIQPYFSFAGIEAQTWADSEIYARMEGLVRERIRVAKTKTIKWGTALSGGPDSSTVSALVAKAQGSDSVNAFNLCYRGEDEESPGMQDRKHARMVADMHRNISLREVDVAPVGAYTWEKIVEVIRKAGRPLELAESVGIANLFSAVSQAGFEVLLPGHGPDEYWSGYDQYLSYYFRLAAQGQSIQQIHDQVASGRYYDDLGRMQWAEKLGFKPREELPVYASTLLQSGYRDPMKAIMYHMSRGFTPCCAEMFYHFAHSCGVIEFPTFLSLPMTQMAFAYPEELKRQGPCDPTVTKKGLRRIFQNILPHALWYGRPKSGFPPPRFESVAPSLKQILWEQGMPFGMEADANDLDQIRLHDGLNDHQPLYFLVSLRAWEEVFF
jgi:asparagine synthetase B (glutamine-hydrolysing)